uniref:uncharacterized protein LOC120344371 isoform X1 n=1 Tax=Styela clava TaxID=7725 RepID=UPI001939BEB0|nr:uncharacterized protein LOC120344371 isoform X1 [Styela clava]
MANVFTKRSKIPRSTTLGDFGYRSQALRQLNISLNKDKGPEITRILSPTRRQNPQPIGLVYQSPYNRYNNVFGIWNPNQMMPVMRCEQTLPHLRRTNFTCQHDISLLKRYMAPADPGAPVQRKEPEIKFKQWTIQRKSYKWPPEVPEKFQGMVKHTRFGHTPYGEGPASRTSSPVFQAPTPSAYPEGVTKVEFRVKPSNRQQDPHPRDKHKRNQTQSTTRIFHIRPHPYTEGKNPPATGPGSFPVSLPLHKKGQRRPPKTHRQCCERPVVIV